jgi:hypothetical protein
MIAEWIDPFPMVPYISEGGRNGPGADRCQLYCQEQHYDSFLAIFFKAFADSHCT